MPTLSSGSLERIEAFDSAFVPSRYIDVWLPDNYSEKTQYHVLYMHDGRMLFDGQITWNKQEWGVDETVSTLIKNGVIPPTIVVAIPNAVKNRHSEYFPQQPFESLDASTQAAFYKLMRGESQALFQSNVYSDNYLRFLVEELIPHIENNYPVKKGGSNRTLAGASMGGLISWYALLQYPEEFSAAVCMSTHWPGVFDTDNPAFDAFLAFIEQHIDKLTTQKLYFDYGDATLDAMYPPLQKRVDAVLQQSELPGEQWMSIYDKGAAHTETAWASRLEAALTFALNER